MHQRDEERERNITKRAQEFEKTFDFVNSHLLKGVATMAELTKTDNRQPMGRIKPTDKIVMMPSLFDGTKPATSKQHYERFNLYINFQTKSGHLTDCPPICLCWLLVRKEKKFLCAVTVCLYSVSHVVHPL